jgi:damage-control phosphatase, subfamily I
MRTYLECIPCFVRQAHDALRQVTDDEALTHRVLQRVLIASSEFEMDLSPPEMAQTIHRIIREETGNPDPYAEIKAESTAVALRLAEEARPLINGAIDPFKMALRFSIAGNIMDFALTSKWDQMNLSTFLDDTRLQSLESEAVEPLREAARKARTILFLGDNAGEAVFDRLLIEQMPNAQTTYAVKGAPIINDVTLAEARASGLDEVAELIDNGNDAPGTILSLCPPAFQKRFAEADLVIAKGQANYETLSETDRDLFFLTQVKCPVIGRDIGKPVGSWIVQYHAGPNTGTA